MNDVILTNTAKPNAITGAPDVFVGIGHGIEVALPEGVKSGDSWELTIEPLCVADPLAHTLLGEELFVSNENELLAVLSANLLVCNNSDKGTHDHLSQSNPHLHHKSTKLATYFNHIFLAIGRTLWWTDLDNYWNWYPAVDSEADFRTLDWEKDDITALVVLNDILYIHFPEAIYECTYTGKPAVVRILRRVTGAGALNQRSVLATKNALFFLGLENFYVWSPDIGLKEIGPEIWSNFLDSSPDPSTTWAYHDIRNRELCWVNNGIIWAFNHIEGHWQKYSTDGAISHTTSPWHVDFLPIAEGDTGLIVKPDKWDGVENLWVGEWGVAREMRVGDGLATVLPMESPYLESDDLTYGDIHSYKNSDLVVLDAELGHPWVGVRVWVAGKKRVKGETVWLDKGVWREGMEHVDFTSVSGKSLRYRFELVSGLVTANGSFLPNGGQRLDGKRLDLLNGSVKLDGSNKPHESSYYSQTETSSWRSEVYAWGERVDLPERLIGPDK